MNKLFTLALATTALLGSMAPLVQAQEWPERPVQLVVVAGAGGGSDYTFRLLAAELEAALGQPFPVVNLAQASGIVGYTTYTSSPPDGYTLGQLSPSPSSRFWGRPISSPRISPPSRSSTPIPRPSTSPPSPNIRTWAR